MEQNQPAHGASAGAASDSYAPLLPNQAAAAQAAEPEQDEHAFASEAEEDAYWAGVADGIRHGGDKVPPRLAARAAKQQLLVQVHEGTALGAPRPGDLLDFTPVSVERRANGWTPEKQRAFVEALADTGVIRAAAARVGMTEQSAGWLRRRADARTFDLACTAAQEIGARRILSVAYERAIEGTIKCHYYRGELKAEERVYDNRLLINLLSRIPVPAAPDPQAQEVERNWDQWMDAIEQGAPPPAPATAATPSDPADTGNHPRLDDPRPDPDGLEPKVWLDEEWLTNCAPPPGFHGYSLHEPGDRLYQRRLTTAEEAYWDETGADAVDAAGGYDGDFFYYLGRPDILPLVAENSEKSTTAAAARPARTASEAARAPTNIRSKRRLTPPEPRPPS